MAPSLHVLRERHHVKSGTLQLVSLLFLLGLKIYAQNNELSLSGDVLPVEDIPGSVVLPPREVVAAPYDLSLGGFVYDTIHGRGPARDDAAEVARAKELESKSAPVPLKKMAVAKIPRLPKIKDRLVKPEAKIVTRRIASQPTPRETSKTTAKAVKAPKNKKRFELRLKAQFWRVVPGVIDMLLGETDAHARRKFDQNALDGVRSALRQTRGREPTDEEVEETAEALASGAGQGGQGSGGGGSSGGSGESLFAVAALIAATSPAVMAAIQASADKSIASTNANAQVAMTEISADTSKYLSENQKEVAIEQALVARDINKNNLDSSETRLSMQLSELRDARRDNNAMELRKMDYQQQLDLTRLQLAKEQMLATQQLAQAQMKLQLSIAGIQGGAVLNRSSLSVRRNGGSFSAGSFTRTTATAARSNRSGSGALLASAKGSTSVPPTIQRGVSASGIAQASLAGAAPAVRPATSVVRRGVTHPWDATFNVASGGPAPAGVPVGRRNMTPLVSVAGGTTGEARGAAGRHQRGPASTPDAR